MFVNLSLYLESLKVQERFAPDGQLLKVPSLSELARSAGVTPPVLTRLASGKTGSMNLETAAAIIREMRYRGFPMQITDLIDYIGPDERPREVVLEEFNSKDQRA